VPYRPPEERIDHLEAALTSFIRHSEEGNAELRRGFLELQEGTAGLRESTAALQEGTAVLRESTRALQENVADLQKGSAVIQEGFAVLQRGAASIQEGFEVLQKTTAAFEARVDQDIAEMREWRIQSQKQWGEIAQKLGKFVEDIVAPNIPRIGTELLGPECEELFSAPRIRVRHPQDRARIREFDYVYATTGGWIIVESKADPKLKDIDQFREMLAEAPEYFPQYAALPLCPVFASLYVPGHVVDYCTRHRIYALGMGAETMQLLNASPLQSDASGG
jgi:hypothetical protein